MNGYALSHFKWSNHKVCMLDGVIKRVAFNSTTTLSDAGIPDNSYLQKESEVAVAELRVDNSKSSAPTNLADTGKRVSYRSSMNLNTNASSTSSGLAGRALLYVSPSGDYIASYWPDACCYVIVHVPNADQMVEVERGYCVEFAWIGVANHYLIKTPAYYITEKPTAKRSSIVGAFFKAEKETKTFKPSEFVLKKCQQTSVTSNQAISFEGYHIVDVFSGNALVANVVASSTDNDQLELFQVPSSESTILPGKDSVRSKLEGRIFVCHNKTDEEIEMRLIGPKSLPPILQVAWDYERSLCSLYHPNGSINILQINQQDCRAIISLQTSSVPFAFQYHSWSSHSFIISAYNKLEIHFLEQLGQETTRLIDKFVHFDLQHQTDSAQHSVNSKYSQGCEIVGFHQGMVLGSIG